MIGEFEVQGTDYGYTLQGWLKGVNTASLDASRDIGKDGDANLIPEDVFGFNLGYNNTDYSAIGSDFDVASSDLFNGNIAHMITAISPTSGSTESFIKV